MATASSSFMAEKSGACVHFTARHRTIVVSIEVEHTDSLTPLLPPPLCPSSPADAAPSALFVVWALMLPQRERTFADNLYTVTTPVPLGVVTFADVDAHAQPREHVTRRAFLCLGRWELCVGAVVVLALAPADASAETVRGVMDAEVNAVSGGRTQGAGQTRSSLSPAPLHWRLCGSQVESATSENELEWQPLLHRRWYELKSYVREGTVVPYFASRQPHHRNSSEGDSESDGDGAAAQPAQPMYAGEVKEADAISINRQCIMWTDGAVGLHDEVKPFFRVYQPARAEKTIRVRRFPHRYADVVGEVPFGQCVEAYGRATDPFTQEQYVLLYLPDEAAFASHIDTYDLTFVEAGRYAWGWSKLAGTSGLPLLVETHRDGDDASGSHPAWAAPAVTAAPTAASRAGGHVRDGGDKTEVMPLPEATFYTPVREGRPVRIRKRPTLTAATIREMEANEVRAADALVTVPLRLAGDASHALVPHVFVQWQQGGYSLLRNAVECFLAPVLLSRVPRRFPIRTRSSGSGSGGALAGDAADEVIDLSRQRRTKRRRSAESDGDTDAEWEAMLRRRTSSTAGGAVAGGGAVAPDDSLLSPYSLPASLKEALRNGVVRLEDLPPLRRPSESSETAGSESSDDF